MHNIIDHHSQVLNFPGGEVKFTSNLNIIPETAEERVHCYRVLDDDGYPITNDFAQQDEFYMYSLGIHLDQIEKEVALKIYTDMVTLQTMDTIFYEAQRQGRISFYVTTLGEEAINIASAAALKTDDFIFPQVSRAHRLASNLHKSHFVELKMLNLDRKYMKSCSFPKHTSRIDLLPNEIMSFNGNRKNMSIVFDL
ncbi:hypothetical protein FXO37_03963 [Capsicum annuum]|nr:hypothetical protein FXO37_03963 [Capsicum annuum]